MQNRQSSSISYRPFHDAIGFCFRILRPVTGLHPPLRRRWHGGACPPVADEAVRSHLPYVHSVSPTLVEPIQILLFWGIGFGAYFGFRTISKKTVLDNTARLQVFNTIREFPGIHFSALRDRTGLNRGTLRYHISILSLAGKVDCFQDGIFSRYVTSERSMSAYDRIVASRFQNGSDRKILSYLLDHPDSSQRDIAGALGVVPSVVNSRIRQLYDEGIVAMERLGRSTQVALTDNAVDVIRRIQSKGIQPDQIPVLAPEIPG